MNEIERTQLQINIADATSKLLGKKEGEELDVAKLDSVFETIKEKSNSDISFDDTTIISSEELYKLIAEAYDFEVDDFALDDTNALMNLIKEVAGLVDDEEQITLDELSQYEELHKTTAQETKEPEDTEETKEPEESGTVEEESSSTAFNGKKAQDFVAVDDDKNTVISKEDLKNFANLSDILKDIYGIEDINSQEAQDISNQLRELNPEIFNAVDGSIVSSDKDLILEKAKLPEIFKGEKALNDVVFDENKNLVISKDKLDDYYNLAEVLKHVYGIEDLTSSEAQEISKQLRELNPEIFNEVDGTIISREKDLVLQQSETKTELPENFKGEKAKANVTKDENENLILSKDKLKDFNDLSTILKDIFGISDMTSEEAQEISNKLRELNPEAFNSVDGSLLTTDIDILLEKAQDTQNAQETSTPQNAQETEKSETTDKTETSESSDKTSKTSTTDKTETGKTQKAEETETTEKSENTSKTSTTDKTQETEKSETTDKTETTESSDETSKTSTTGKTEETEETKDSDETLKDTDGGDKKAAEEKTQAFIALTSSVYNITDKNSDLYKAVTETGDKSRIEAHRAFDKERTKYIKYNNCAYDYTGKLLYDGNTGKGTKPQGF